MGSPDKAPKRPLSNKKLLLSKWTAVAPQNREKHFLVSRIHDPRDHAIPPGFVELEAVFTQRRFNIAIDDLLNSADWQIGWQSTIKEQA
jgi:tryptophan-rich hypothetical protein